MRWRGIDPKLKTALNKKRIVGVSESGVARRRIVPLSRGLAGLASSGSSGMRDYATPLIPSSPNNEWR
jgi:hypothetical protein